MSLLVNSVWPRNVHVADRAERWLREHFALVIHVDSTLAMWPEWARRAVMLLPSDGSILGWNKMFVAFDPALNEEKHRPYGPMTLVDRIASAGLIERVFWNPRTGEEFAEEEAHRRLVAGRKPDASRAAKAWLNKTCVGYRLPRSGDVGDEKGAAAR